MKPRSFISILCAAVLLAVSLPTAVATAAVSGDYTYTVENGEATITRASVTSGELVIPQVLDGYPVTAIGSRAFSYCDRLQSLTLGAGVITVSSDAFMGSKNIRAIEVSEDNPAFCDVDGVVFTKDKTTLVYYPPQKSDESYRIPDGVQVIGDYAFANNQYLKTVHIPDSVETIGNHAFEYGCLTAVSLGQVKSIGSHAFHSNDLTEVTIPDSVETIGDSAFSLCLEMKHVSIGAGVKTLGTSVFVTTTSMESIVVSEDNPAFTDVDGVLFSRDMTVLLYRPAERPETQYTIPDGVQHIEYGAFYMNAALTEVTMPSSVKAIGPHAFSDCYNLKRITIAPGVETIGVNAFASCSALEEIHLPDSIQSLSGAFWRCTSLKSIRVPDSITAIDSMMFFGCTSLTTVTIPRRVTSIGFCAFEECDRLKTVIYSGSERDRAAITVDQGNVRVELATWEYAYIHGDLNDDGTLNTLDALQLYVAVSGAAVPDETLLDRADLNDDGMVNMTDALLLFRTASGY